MTMSCSSRSLRQQILKGYLPNLRISVPQKRNQLPWSRSGVSFIEIDRLPLEVGRQCSWELVPARDVNAFKVRYIIDN